MLDFFGRERTFAPFNKNLIHGTQNSRPTRRVVRNLKVHRLLLPYPVEVVLEPCHIPKHFFKLLHNVDVLVALRSRFEHLDYAAYPIHNPLNYLKSHVQVVSLRSLYILDTRLLREYASTNLTLPLVVAQLEAFLVGTEPAEIFTAVFLDHRAPPYTSNAKTPRALCM